MGRFDSQIVGNLSDGTVIMLIFRLFGLMLNVPVNNSSVMLIMLIEEIKTRQKESKWRPECS